MYNLDKRSKNLIRYSIIIIIANIINRVTFRLLLSQD